MQAGNAEDHARDPAIVVFGEATADSRIVEGGKGRLARGRVALWRARRDLARIERVESLTVKQREDRFATGAAERSRRSPDRRRGATLPAVTARHGTP